MKFKPTLWQPIAVVLSAVNLAGIGAAAAAAEPWHAGIHGALAVGFGLWAQRLGARKRGETEVGDALPQDRLDALESDVGELRRELSEAQERIDFAERLLAQGSETRRVPPAP
jgi:hypothetical protein